MKCKTKNGSVNTYGGLRLPQLGTKIRQKIREGVKREIIIFSPRQLFCGNSG